MCVGNLNQSHRRLIGKPRPELVRVAGDTVGGAWVRPADALALIAGSDDRRSLGILVDAMDLV